MIFIRPHTVFLLLLLHLTSPAYAEGLAYPPELEQELLSAFNSKPDAYQPRTQHLCENNRPCFINRLVLESSPYLLQHAHNPVDWYAWNKEALDKAKRENKPIFLSIGYAACHWCHVMEEESFDNLEVAQFLNEHFIAIKVDRESRPDIDEFYANAVLHFQPQQGWPMSLFLTPEAKPFYAGGYYSRDDFYELLSKMHSHWSTQQQDALLTAEQIINQLQGRRQSQEKASLLDADLRKEAIKDLLSIVDTYYGGFGQTSKFPHEPWLFLLQDNSLDNSVEADSITALNTSLSRMLRGGIYDQVGGGFHRYTTDPYWKIPHFEKMLYTQALLIRLYLAANTVQANPDYVRVVKQTLAFLLEEMRAPDGGFYAAIDADSEGQEGGYYLWRLEDFQQALDPADQVLATELFGVDKYGEIDGANILYLTQTLQDYADEREIATEILLRRVDKVRAQLQQARDRRSMPLSDTKVIMAWTGLVITGLAESYAHLGDPDYLRAATEAADYIWKSLKKEQGFYRLNFQGNNSQAAQLDDYAYYLQALISLYDVDPQDSWLQRAEALVQIMMTQLWDSGEGGFFQTPGDENAPLPLRPKSAFDKVLPAGNAVAAQALIRLTRRTGDPQYQQTAKQILSTFAAQASELPSAFSSLLIAAHELQAGERQLPLYAARGNIRIDATLTPLDETHYDLRIIMQLRDGWHINAHQPLQQHLIPTNMVLMNSPQWQIESVQYPQQAIIKLDFSEQMLALYQGEFHIKSQLNRQVQGLNPIVRLDLQACNDRLCLPPEKLLFFPRGATTDH